MDGLLPVWKPAGMSSYDVIRIIKHGILKQLPGKIKIGHAGTLDPFAEGVLILMLGRATRRFDEIMTWGKTYRAVARLGATSDTLDRTGKIELRFKIQDLRKITKNEIQMTANGFIGEIEQKVPIFSAAKYKGKTLYRYAREGIVVPEKKKKVVIYSLDIERFHVLEHGNDGECEFVVSCSSGTYIRQLSYDIFRTLGYESYLEKLIREKVGEIEKKDCLTIDQLTDVDTVLLHVQHGDDVSGT